MSDINTDYVSFSRLNSYSDCSQYYNFKYVNKQAATPTPNISFLIGDAIHKCLEYAIENDIQNNELTLLKVIPDWLTGHGLQFSTEDIQTIGLNFGKVLQRCSVNYNGADAIRNKDKSILKDPIGNPSRSYQDALKDLGATPNRLRYIVNSTAAAQDSSTWIDNNFCDFLTIVYSAILGFKKPNWFGENYGIEYPISTTEDNVVYLDKEKTIKFKGYIDWIIKSPDGAIAIGDHKSSTKLINPEDVMCHPQLNLYAYALHQLTGLYPDVLFIHHVRSGTYVLTEFDVEVMEETVKYFNNIYKLVKQESFVKRHPSDFNSPCMSRDWKTGLVKTKCEYLQHCWPIYNNLLENP
jgi:hypothetical protein